MTTFTIEILREIFLHLHQYDKVECMLVCRHWKDTIEKFALYQTVFIYSEVNQKKLIDKIKQEPTIANKVEQLMIISMDMGINTSLKTLLLLVPNLRVLNYSDRSYKVPSLEDTMDFPLKNSIEEITDFSKNGSAFNIILSGKCPKLTSLKTEFQSEYIDLYQNMPALTSLYFREFDITFDALEVLHGSLPQLKSFEILGGILTGSAFSDEDVRPATAITKCTFSMFLIRPNNCDTRLKLLKYISKKYPNLSTLTFRTHSLKVRNSRDINKLDEPGWLPLFRSLGLGLKQLFIDDSACPGTLFGLLDKSECQVNSLRFESFPLERLTSMIQSQQIRYIQTLDVRIAKGQMPGGGYDWLRGFQVLNELKLTHSNRSLKFKLSDILNNAPSTLKILSFSWCHFDMDVICPTTYNLEQLSFHRVKLAKKMDTFMTEYLPKLTELALKRCEVPENMLDLRNMKLLRFCFASAIECDTASLLTICNNEQRRYTYRETDNKNTSFMQFSTLVERTLYVPFTSAIDDGSRLRPELTLKCNSVNQVIFPP